MILKRIYNDKLAQASYLVGCGATGEALVVDANRDVEQYINGAAAEGLRITHITETHMHADFVSGSRELATRTGATMYLSGEGDENWKYAFAESAGATLLTDGDTFNVGSVLIHVMYTPGHTPEHLTFLVTDTVAADQPIAALTGDFVFVGDVGRPDLLETAAGMKGTMEAGARTLFRSLHKFKTQPDYLQLLPGHGAGSACGKGISAVPSSTIGYERRFNWAFGIEEEDEFVSAVLAGQPEPPRYFAEMKRINREGPRILGGLRLPPRLGKERLSTLLTRDALVIDARPAAEYATGHIAGTINIPLNRSFSTWAGWLVPFHREFYLLVADERMGEAVRDLAMIGLDQVGGYFTPEVLGTYKDDGGELETIARITSSRLAQELSSGEVAVLDVRGRAEWQAGHLPGVANIPVGYLPNRLDELPRGMPLVVHCQGGARSAIAASLLKSRGFRNVINLEGGYAAWAGAGYPTAAGATTQATTVRSSR